MLRRVAFVSTRGRFWIGRRSKQSSVIFLESKKETAVDIGADAPQARASLSQRQ